MLKVCELKDEDCRALIDERFDPVIVASFYGGITPKVLLEFCTWYRGYMTSLRTGAKFVLINDPRGVRSYSPVLRKLAVEEMKKLGALMDRHCLENIMIVDSALLRGAITALHWVLGKSAHTAVKDMPEAITIAVRALSRAGLPAPAGVDPSNYEASLAPLKKFG